MNLTNLNINLFNGHMHSSPHNWVLLFVDSFVQLEAKLYTKVGLNTHPPPTTTTSTNYLTCPRHSRNLKLGTQLSWNPAEHNSTPACLIIIAHFKKITHDSTLPLFKQSNTSGLRVWYNFSVYHFEPSLEYSVKL